MTDEPQGNEMPLDPEMRQQFVGVMSMLPSRPTMTILAVIANVAVFVAMVASGVDIMNPNAQTLIDWGADFGPRTLNGEWWRMVSCTFLHSGIIHLGMNMFVLWGLGRLTERFVGSMGFAVAYMISGVAGSIVSLAWNPQGISVGASGAVFGVAGTLLGFVVCHRAIKKHHSAAWQLTLVNAETNVHRLFWRAGSGTHPRSPCRNQSCRFTLPL